MHVGLVERLAVDIDLLGPQFDRFARQADHPLDEIAVRFVGILEDDDVAAADVRTGSSARSIAARAGPKTNLLTSR